MLSSLRYIYHLVLFSRIWVVCRDVKVLRCELQPNVLFALVCGEVGLSDA